MDPIVMNGNYRPIKAPVDVCKDCEFSTDYDACLRTGREIDHATDGAQNSCPTDIIWTTGEAGMLKWTEERLTCPKNMKY